MNLGLLSFSLVSAAAVVLGLCMVLGVVSGRLAEGLAVIFVGVMAALWANANTKAAGS